MDSPSDIAASTQQLRKGSGNMLAQSSQRDPNPSLWNQSQAHDMAESIERSSLQQQQQYHQSRPAKVAIPRNLGGLAPRYTRRVAKACESCRQRKTKCSGDTPVCRQCRELRIPCQYPDGLREKTKRHMDALTAKTNEYESLLRELRSSVSEDLANKISATLNRCSADGDGDSAGQRSSSSRTPLDDADLEPSSPSSVGSLEAIDRVEEDLNRGENVRATGYIGKNSEISWMQRLQRETEQRSRKEAGMYDGKPVELQHEDFSINSVSYHLDDLDISVSGPVDVYYVPPREQAERLFEDYLTTVHPHYPIINRPLFRSQFRYFLENPTQPGDKWRAILNMIFAIASKHSHLVQAPWKGDDPQEHLLYFTRARHLSMTSDVLFSHPDLQQVQVEGLIAFYLLSTDQINRAWRISSLAVRSAITLGINMKNTSETTPSASKESRYRVWWSLYSFEHLLGVMTGRATCILDGICTTPLPIPFEEEKFHDPDVDELLSNSNLREQRVQAIAASHMIRMMSLNPQDGKSMQRFEKSSHHKWFQSIPLNSGLFFLLYMDLSVITQEIINKVYTSDAVRVPWSNIENRIGELESRIDLWFEQLPDACNFTQKDSSSPDQVRAKVGLAFQYYSARITLGRPCLCRRDSRSNTSSTFSHKMALVTLESSTRMLDLIPDPPDPFQLYQLGPWWCILHFLMQAATVLLLELSFGCVHVPEDEANIFKACKKAIRWLYAMSEHSTASRRAWALCDGCMRRIATGMDYDVSDLPPLPNDDMLQHYPNSQSQDTAHTIPTTSLDTAAGKAAFEWSTGMESMGVLHTEGSNQDVSGTAAELDNSVNSSEMDVSYPLSFPPSMGFTPNVEFHFPYDPISGEFMDSFFPYTGDDHHNWSG